MVGFKCKAYNAHFIANLSSFWGNFELLKSPVYLKSYDEDMKSLNLNPVFVLFRLLQDLQSDVFGGGMGMTGKFWNMYKGSSSYDSFDDSDSDVMDKITDSDDDMMEADGESVGRWRQAAEVDQPEDEPNNEDKRSGKAEETMEVQDETVMIAYQVLCQGLR